MTETNAGPERERGLDVVIERLRDDVRGTQWRLTLAADLLTGNNPWASVDTAALARDLGGDRVAIWEAADALAALLSDYKAAGLRIEQLDMEVAALREENERLTAVSTDMGERAGYAEAENAQLRSRLEEAERLAREWTDTAPSKFAALPRAADIELLSFALFLYAKGLRSKLDEAGRGRLAAEARAEEAERERGELRARIMGLTCAIEGLEGRVNQSDLKDRRLRADRAEAWQAERVARDRLERVLHWIEANHNALLTQIVALLTESEPSEEVGDA